MITLDAIAADLRQALDLDPVEASALAATHAARLGVATGDAVVDQAAADAVLDAAVAERTTAAVEVVTSLYNEGTDCFDAIGVEPISEAIPPFSQLSYQDDPQPGDRYRFDFVDPEGVTLASGYWDAPELAEPDDDVEHVDVDHDIDYFTPPEHEELY